MWDDYYLEMLVSRPNPDHGPSPSEFHQSLHSHLKRKTRVFLIPNKAWVKVAAVNMTSYKIIEQYQKRVILTIQ